MTGVFRRTIEELKEMPICDNNSHKVLQKKKKHKYPWNF